MKKLFLLFLTMTPFLAHDALSQSQEQRIYHIELIVFERTTGSETSDSEQWSKNLELSYPENRRKLINPKVANTPADNTNPTEHGHTPDFQLSGDFLRSLGRSVESEQYDSNTSLSNDGNPNDGGATLSTDSIAEKPADRDSLSEQDNTGTENAKMLPAFLEYLNEENRHLDQKRKSIDRTRGLRTLFHQAWFQDLKPRSQAPAILMQGGNLFGLHHELEGSITLSVNRYLHISTDLWLSSFAPDHGQSSEHWPQLPSPDRQYLWQPIPLNSNSRQTGPSDQLELAFSSPDSSGFRIRSDDDTAPSPQPVNTYESPYLIRQIVTLRQKRKMRSGELHYIDHPRIGLLVKITPYEPPELDVVKNG